MGLRWIALLEGAKGLLVIAAVAGFLNLRHTDLHEWVDTFLRQHGLNPEHHYTRVAIDALARASHYHTRQIVALGCLYSLVRFIEAYGLWYARHWAEWFAALSAAIYLPFELHHFMVKPSLFTAGIILFNLALVTYLGKLLLHQRAERHRAKLAAAHPIEAQSGVQKE
jgi:uncharacterized membrane protein (DUF2068 family)